MAKTTSRARLQGVVGAFEKDPERDFYCFDFEGGYHQGGYRKCKILNIKVVVEHSDGLMEMDLDDLRLSDPNAALDLSCWVLTERK